MVKEGLKKILPVMQAFVEGKTIQRYDDKKDDWYDVSPNANIDFCYDYRIKPEQTYRSFKTQKECWEEMHKHSDFGWVKGTGEYVDPKFDPKTLKPFDKVLVRDSGTTWRCNFFSHIENSGYVFPYATNGGHSAYCIPYNNDTKHLVGTKDEPLEFYRYWED